MNSSTMVIVPCYNEAERLDPEAFLNFARINPDIRFLFVNDGSADGTKAILDRLAAKMPHAITVHHLPKNSGKGEAVRQGFLKAFSLNAGIIGFLDADLATPLEAIPILVSYIADKHYEIAMGARVALLGRSIERRGWRHIAGRFFATAASLILKLRVYDTQCGAKFFRTTDRLKRVMALPFTVKWIFDVEILARFVLTEREGLSPVSKICVEHPLERWMDKKGSKLRFKDFIVSGLDLVRISRLMKKKSL